MYWPQSPRIPEGFSFAANLSLFQARLSSQYLPCRHVPEGSRRTFPSIYHPLQHAPTPLRTPFSLHLSLGVGKSVSHHASSVAGGPMMLLHSFQLSSDRSPTPGTQPLPCGPRAPPSLGPSSAQQSVQISLCHGLQIWSYVRQWRQSRRICKATD